MGVYGRPSVFLSAHFTQTVFTTEAQRAQRKHEESDPGNLCGHGAFSRFKPGFWLPLCPLCLCGELLWGRIVLTGKESRIHR
jgi:hypothetical protein